MPPAARKPTNVTLDAALIEEARTHGVNVSRAAEEGLREAVRRARWDAWRRENGEAMRAWNEWVEKNGLPLAEYRQF